MTYKVTNIFNQLKKRAKPIPAIPEKIWQNPLYFLAFGLGAGAMPFAPGTFGTLLAIPFYLLLRPLPLVFYISFVLIFIVVASWICEKVSKEINVHDHPGMCIDEFVGYFVTMIHAPHRWEFVVLGFLLFRLFDIWKPGPIRYLDNNLKGGVGVVMDDVAAGIASLIVLQLIAYIA